MCTVTYIPTEKGFIFTSNRDEQYSRSKTNFPVTEQIGKETVTYPQDPLANGTWIATSANRLICLLNGGDKKHVRKLHYEKSRGIIVLEQFLEQNFNTFVQHVDLNNIEPFTMICLEWNKTHTVKIQELIWDGATKHTSSKQNDLPYIWSSSTLYIDVIKKQRTFLFDKAALSNKDEILNFHLNEGTELGKENRFKMERKNGVKTISTTQIIAESKSVKMTYINHEENSKLQIKITRK